MVAARGTNASDLQKGDDDDDDENDDRGAYVSRRRRQRQPGARTDIRERGLMNQRSIFKIEFTPGAGRGATSFASSTNVFQIATGAWSEVQDKHGYQRAVHRQIG